MPSGQPWSPDGSPLRLECQPILAWDSQDLDWIWETAKEIDVEMAEAEIFKGGWGTAAPPSIFIAYRMQNPESITFRRKLEEAIRRAPKLDGATVLDGHVHAGVPWAAQIRDSLKKCKLVVADVTGMRPDVMFELGLASGLGRPAIPVMVGSSREPSELGRWLTSSQIARFSASQDASDTVRSIIAHLSDPEILRNSKLPEPIPGLMVWLRKLEWNSHMCEQFVSFSTRNSLKQEVWSDDIDDDQVIRRAARASVLVVSLDSTEKDAMMHFICGSVLAKPKAGVASHRLNRRILILEEPVLRDRGLIAESLRRCSEIVTIVDPRSLITQLESFLADYKRWTSTADGSRRRRRS
jgi:hypothetical protein